MPSDEQNPRLLARPFTLNEIDPRRRGPSPRPSPGVPGEGERRQPSRLIWLGFCTVVGGAAGMVLTAIVKAIAAAALR